MRLIFRFKYGLPSLNYTLFQVIFLPWGIYEYQKFPMGLSNSPDIFQEEMKELFNDSDNVRMYIDYLLIISDKSLEDNKF